MGTRKGGLPIHQRVNRVVFGNTWKTRIFDEMTEAVDTYKESTWDSYFHAMSSHKRYIGTSIMLANEHVRSGFGVARYYINRGDGRNAYRTLGWVLHTMQDSTSRAHKYFQKWHGATWKYRTEEWANHVRQEMWSGQVRDSVYRASRWVWHMFYYRLVPSGNVFIF